MPDPYNFREFFTLIQNPNNKSNAKAVCNFCSLKNGGTQAAALIPEYYTTNKAILCRNHLANCNNFKDVFTEEVEEILSRPVPEDKRNNSADIMNNNDATISRPIKRHNSSISTVSNIAASKSNQQTSLHNYYRRPMSQKDIPTFETLVIRMCISNGLLFSFIENEETQGKPLIWSVQEISSEQS
ncbi:4713_t:CDS:2 [Racocetra persica]|uniref:4713_t:CDS:1 n=1 Tax=Racocetra persica TaxID=160502 RepID=A0ACA9LSV4_9GLOM|nr:4713_t:CDS:2 [Racocetra persica]